MAETLWWLDGTRGRWGTGMRKACQRHGWAFREIEKGEEREGGLGFIRPSAAPGKLMANRLDYAAMAGRGAMVQDGVQVRLYDDKWTQAQEFGTWLPETHLCTSESQAQVAGGLLGFPLVVKADVGASSVNVHVIHRSREYDRLLKEVFRGKGWLVAHCADGARSRQKGRLLVQQFIPHDVTWRVNVLGEGRAAFRRFNYPDRPVAQTGNVEPVMALDETVESLLRFVDRLASLFGTRWCAFDILRDGDRWRLLETSLAWPWPSPGDCMSAPIFRTPWTWEGLWDSLLEQAQSGVFGALRS
jgi:glutathione synthase/RimK-type ligase-like ATP-grasp enzyme